MEEGRQAVHEKLGGGRSRQKLKQQGRHGKSLRRQPRIGRNENLWSEPYVALRHKMKAFQQPQLLTGRTIGSTSIFAIAEAEIEGY